MKSILIVILGCNILNILYDRINVAVQLGNLLSGKTTITKRISELNYTDDLFQKLSENTINQINEFNDLNESTSLSIDWFLTGGIKDQSDTKIKAEAARMVEELDANGYGNGFSNYIIDSNSTNTVENFIYLKKYLEFNNTHNYTDIYVITSKFHHTRANLILSKIIPNNNFTWVLSNETTKDLEFWESYHINNVYRDIQRSIYTHNITLEM